MIEPIRYLQTDPRWDNHNYSVGCDISTLGITGCGPTVMAMVVSTFTNKMVTPPMLANWAMENGYRRLYQGTDYAFFKAVANVYGLEVLSEVSYDEALDAVHSDNLVICQMGPGNWSIYGDYILWYNENAGVSRVMDPQSETEHRSITSTELLKLQAKRYWVVKNPIPVIYEVPNVPPTAEITHVIFDINDDKRYYPAVRVNGSMYVGIRRLLDNLGFDLTSGENGVLVIHEKGEQGN